MIFPVGPLVNAVAIVCGALIGIAIGSRLPDRIRTIVFQGLGLCTLLIGMQMALGTQSPLILIFSILLGGICGELLRLEDRFLNMGNSLKGLIKSKNPRFTEGLVSATVLFCIGAMAILGSFDEGLRGDYTIVFSKTILDAFASIALASVYGIGVAFAGLAVFLYQGILVLFAGVLQPWLSEALMVELTATGGVLILGIGLNLLEVTQIRLSNMLPALIFAVIISAVVL